MEVGGWGVPLTENSYTVKLQKHKKVLEYLEIYSNSLREQRFMIRPAKK